MFIQMLLKQLDVENVLIVYKNIIIEKFNSELFVCKKFYLSKVDC